MSEPQAATDLPRPESPLARPSLFVRWALVLLPALAVWLVPAPAGISASSWGLLAVFVGTIAGLIFQPLPGGAIVLLGVAIIAVTGILPIGEALKGYGDPIVWLVLAAFFMSRGMIKTGLGRRIALLFIRALGRRSLGLGYAMIGTDALLATFIPSNAARCGGIIFPIAKSLAEAYESRPGPTAGRLGAFLMVLLYQADVVICAMFLTGQASNVLIARFAQEATGFELSYPRWALGALLPGLACVALVPLLLYRWFPPEIRKTPAAAEFAAGELARMGPMSRGEWLMLLVFGLVASLWMTTALHGINYAVIALGGIGVLLLTRVLEWEDALAERAAWDVFVWYGGLLRMASALGESGITERFAQAVSGHTVGWPWWAAFAALVLIYFYAHYGFASITAHATAMYPPFLAVIVVAGAPPILAAVSLAYLSNLMAALTHYGTTPAPIYFGAGYVSQRTWWRLGFQVSAVTLGLFIAIGLVWWKILGWW